jgi:hypothetical protein
MRRDTLLSYPGRGRGHLICGTTMSDDPMHVPPRHRLDIISDPGFVILRRLDGTVVARFTVRGAIWEEILRAAEEDEAEAGGD